MSPACPRGHASIAADYCDECGVPMTDPPVIADRRQTAIGEPRDGGPRGLSAGDRCPHCHAAGVAGERFCESCGRAFDAIGDGSPASPAQGGQLWELVATTDGDRLRRFRADGAAHATGRDARTFALDRPRLRIGRRSASRGIRPEIDLAGAPEDIAISHQHAVLVRRDGDGFAVVDEGSTNGTRVSGDPKPLAPGEPVALADGDSIRVGAWTVLTIRRASAASAAQPEPGSRGHR